MKHSQTYPLTTRRGQQRGFTLVELLVTIVILAILSMLGIPSFTKFLREWQRDSVSRELMTAVQTARAEAIKSSRKVVLCPSSNGTSCANGSDWKGGWLAFVDTDGDEALDSGERLIAVRSSAANVSSMSGSDSVTKLVFLPNGLTGSAATTIAVIPNGGTALKLNEIAVNRVGRATLTSKEQE